MNSSVPSRKEEIFFEEVLRRRGGPRFGEARKVVTPREHGKTEEGIVGCGLL